MTSSEHTGSGASVTLYEFPLSHYNEKARWVLDYKQVPYRSHPVLPGFHFGTIRRLSGQTETPVVQIGDEVVSGSTNIVARIDAMKSDRSLFPTAPEARKETLEWVTWLDDEVGPAVRLALFEDLLVEPWFAATFFTQGVSQPASALYRLSFPLVAQALKRKVRVSASAAQEARALVDRALIRVSDAAKATGYLVGEEFSAADLTAGALFFPLFYPKELRSGVPDRSRPVFKGWLDRWCDHPGRDYIEGLFRKHR